MENINNTLAGYKTNLNIIYEHAIDNQIMKLEGELNNMINRRKDKDDIHTYLNNVLKDPIIKKIFHIYFLKSINKNI